MQLYRSSDASAPVINAAQTNPTQLFNLLKAVLVNGYGEKPGAGWTLVHETSRALWFRNASASGCVGIYHMPGGSGYDYRVYLCESIDPNPTGDIPAGANRRTGRYSLEYAGTIYPQCFMLYLSGVAGACSWTVAADADTFILLVSAQRFYAQNSGNVWVYGNRVALYVGNTLNGKFVSIGGITNSGSYAGLCPFGGVRSSFSPTSSHAAATVLRDPLTGLAPLSSAVAPIFDWLHQWGGEGNMAAQGSSWYYAGHTPPAKVTLEQPEMFYGGVATGDHLKGIAIPRGLENMHFQLSYEFLTGSKLSDTAQIFSPVTDAGYGQIVPFSGDEWHSNVFWLMLDPSWWA